MKYLCRFVWYIASRLTLFCLVLGMMVVTFYYAMNMTNIYVVLKDGMALRAQVVMMVEEQDELPKYFSTNFLAQDAAVVAMQQGNSPYKDYNIRGIDHRLSMSFAWMWPWDEVVRLEITERIPAIDGRAKGSRAEALVAAGGSSALYPPKWHSGKYRVTLMKDNGQWRIRSLTLLENLAE